VGHQSFATEQISRFLEDSNLDLCTAILRRINFLSQVSLITYSDFAEFMVKVSTEKKEQPSGKPTILTGHFNQIS